jgi:hypothetical protein
VTVATLAAVIRAAAIPLATLAALLCAVAPAAALGPAEPPSAAALSRSTDRLLAQPGFARTAPLPKPTAATDALFPDSRMLALYGAPQLRSTALGSRKPGAAARLLSKQVAPYESLGKRPVTPSFDLIAVVANSTPGPDHLYRTRQPDELIARYLREVRDAGGRLMLDIQPGRSPIRDEIAALADWIAEPDVDVSIDPEWAVGRKGVPGMTVGSVSARELNGASRQIQRIAMQEGLPPKVLVVHQFRTGSIRKRGAVRQRSRVQVTFNFDGIGRPADKIAGYENLSAKRIFNGFSLFYSLDTPLMKPRKVLRLAPSPDFLLYQ